MGSIVRMNQKHPQVVGTCPGRQLKPIAQNHVFKIERPGPPSLKAQDPSLSYLINTSQRIN